MFLSSADPFPFRSCSRPKELPSRSEGSLAQRIVLLPVDKCSNDSSTVVLFALSFYMTCLQTTWSCLSQTPITQEVSGKSIFLFYFLGGR